MPDSTAERPMVEHALRQAARGFRVFPLKVQDFTPAFKDWQDMATSNEATIRSIWGAADWNIGIATGGNLIVLDVDVKNGKSGLESLVKLNLDIDDRLTYTVRTPTNGLHIYYLGLNVANSVERLGPGLDVRGARGYVIGAGSYLPPGVKNGPGGFYTELVPCDLAPLPAVLSERMAAAPERASQTPCVKLDLPDALERARRWLLQEAPAAVQGQGGDNQTFAVAATLRDFGVSEATALDLMLAVWNRRCSPSWNADELRQKVENAYAYGLNPPGCSHPAAEFAGVNITPPDVGQHRHPSRLRYMGDGLCGQGLDWLIKNVLPKSCVALLSGQSRIGKSFLAIDLAGAVATGGTFMGMPVRQQAAVLFVLGEGSGTMEPRLDALRHELPNLSEADLAIMWADASGGQDWRTLIDEAKVTAQERWALPLGMIVFDTLAAVFNVADENDAHSATAAMQTLQKLASDEGALVVGVNHYGKNIDAGVRGSSAWMASADVVFAATGDISERTGEVSGRQLAITKNRYGEARLIGSFELEAVVVGHDSDGEMIQVPFVRRCAPPKKRAAGGKHEALLLSCLHKAAEAEARDTGTIGIAKKSRVRSLFKAEFQTRKLGSMDSGNITRAFSAAIEHAQISTTNMGDETWLVLATPPISDFPAVML